MSVPGVGLLSLLRKNKESEHSSIVLEGKSDGMVFAARSSAVQAVESAVSAGSVADTGSRKQPRGRAIFAGETFYNIDELKEEEVRPNLIMRPVAKVASDFEATYDRLIAVNSSYLCYGLKQGHIRVISRSTGAKALLKGHTGPIADMAIHLSTSLIAAGGRDGKLVVWHLTGAETITATVLLDINIEAKKVLVHWTFDGTALIVAAGQNVGVIAFGTEPFNSVHIQGVCGDFDTLISKGVFAASFYHHAVDEGDIDSLAVSESGGILASSPAWETSPLLTLKCPAGGLSPGMQARLSTVPYELSHEVSISTAKWLRLGDTNYLLLIERGKECKVHLFRADGRQFSLLHSVMFQGDPEPFFVGDVDATNRLLILSESNRKAVFTLHVDTAGEDPYFDYVAGFSVGLPVISFQAFVNQSGLVELNCVQTEAVQQYILDPELCHDDTAKLAKADLKSHPLGRVEATPVTDKAYELPASPPPSPNAAPAIVQVPVPIAIPADAPEPLDIPQPHITPKAPPRLLTPADLLRSRSSSPGAASKEPTPPPQPRILRKAPAEDSKLLNAQMSALHSEIIKTLRTELAAQHVQQQKLLTQALAAQAAAVKSEREAILAEERSTIQRLLEEITHSLTASMRSELESMVDVLAASLAPAITQVLAQSLPGELVSGLKTALPSAVGTGMAKPMQESFKKSFEKQLIPAFEQAVQSMFSQMNLALTQGLEQHLHAQQAALAESTGLAGLLRDSLGALHSTGGAVDETRVHPAATKMDPKTELLALAKAGRYEEAFSKALSLQDVSTVTWLCSQFDAASVLSTEPFPLSQTVLLSLLQQVAAGLGGMSLSVGLSWVREAAMQLAPKDPSISSHVCLVLEQVQAALQQAASSKAHGDAEEYHCKLAMHVIKSQMS